MKTVHFFFLLVVFLGGCATNESIHIQKNYPISLSKIIVPKNEDFPYKLHNHTPIKDALYEEYKKWYGVKYCYGGNTVNGVDCSALVQSIYKDAFNLKIPRTTKYQAHSGYFIKKKDIQEGDLILFKTGYKTRHSAIYIEKGNFIHASSSHGVTISNLNNPYWRTKYWQARRVLLR
jgi:lipoprotein Spr/probable lipoprotein NlpC